ncbi:HisA/HisF-related TIM barrel protein [Ornithinimicrobium cerasi]|uniref:1-(5-phosphoribosyl)-5-[(5-phosphoribosylamino)methylideneamino] imidazole-4-carboxamide isomerase n=1 Tax=Ornithinimicrobium cerasi TaxID=2248773 RepID=A0A285VL87_9MICO|nr:HisA/HisF-related TIM barrel protein [Ornithinimicrobium cerasi]SOC54844.1 1-(5-phosphoribosyl)-5-[(5-phosphoribosylamino)methylideneamino] imidazole-4-carboxamide isomerase [Ornithinimicrobium cerasi]
MTPPLTLLPAVDVAAGRAAQVVDAEGDRGSTADPHDVVSRWVSAGAGWVHLVDLDRAFGRGDNAALMADMVSRCPVRVQLSGGLADEAAVEEALATGADRVVLASALLADPAALGRLVERHGDRVVPAVDVREGLVVSRGTSLTLGPVADVLRATPVLREAPLLLVADASRDGTSAGADLDLFTGVAGTAGVDVVASGGIATLDDVRALRGLTSVGVAGVVLGAALYHGAFTLAEALEVAR